MDHAAIDRSIPERFEWVVARNGARLAVCAESDHWTYDQLNAASNQIGQAILDHAAAGKPSVAALCGHGPAAIRSLMGILKAGKTAVMVDSELPLARIQTILEDAAVGAIVAHGAHVQTAEALTAGMSIAVLNADAVDRSAATPNLAYAISAADAALLLYTSGTTGRPKAVVHSHRSILHRIWVENVEYGVSAEDRFGGLTIASYGASLSEVFGSLLNGASLHMYEIKREGLGRLPAWLAQEQITILRLALTSFRSLAPLLPARAALPHLRLIRTGGDVIRREDIDLYRRHFAPSCVLSISLACTEANTICARFIDHQTPVDEPVVAVGWPIEGKEVLLLDEHGRAAGPDAAGEIAVRSRYLASGYWRRDDLTHARFLPDPADEGLVTYLTGDLGRWRPDGALLHLGRKDAMVKIRGHRVELAEVEGLLQRIDGIEQAAVQSVPTASGDQRLVAYVTPAPGVRLSVARLREEMGRLAPVYMLPARFVILPALPLTTTGKVDRQALLPPGAARPELDTPFVAPRSEVEQQIADIWVESLDLDAVGVEDNFFELGGDSILAMRMVLAVEQALAYDVPAAFFLQPTVAHLARQVTAAHSDANTPDDDVEVTTSATRAIPYLTRQQARRYGLSYGPLWGRFALPYGLGMRLLRAGLALPGLAERRFRRPIALLHEWGRLTGAPPSAATIRQSVLANTWFAWRRSVLTAPLGASHWVEVQGDPAVWQPRQAGPGVIFLATHSRLIWQFRVGLAAGGSAPLFLGQRFAPDAPEMARHAGYAALLDAARQGLARGEAVIVAGDGGYGARGVTLPFCGGQRLFRQGAAELAVATGAELIPFFCAMTADGRVRIEVCPPLMATGGSTEARVETLTRAYAELFVARWPQLYPYQSWGNLAVWLERLRQGQV